MTFISENILKVLAYFDIFNYPLTEKEIFNRLSIKNIKEKLFQDSLTELVRFKLIYQLENFYSLQPLTELAARRIQGNIRAEKSLRIAKAISRFIAGFPFVRCVMLSGTLSKNYMDKDSDFDFFVITQPDRLWIARTSLMLFKKIFLLNSFKYFCINYFIDTEYLEVEEKNIFTATELVTLIPTYDANLYSQFYEANSWVKNYYPNFPMRKTEQVPIAKNNWLKKILEKSFQNKYGEKLDNWLMKITVRYWQKKFTHLSTEEFKIALKSKKYISKHHPKFFQKEILSVYNEKIKKIGEDFRIILN